MQKFIKFEKSPSIISCYSVVGKHEKEGPIGECFDEYSHDETFGKKSWEQAESEMQRMALRGAINKSGLNNDEIDLLIAGDLLNQCVGSTYGLVSFDIPYIGIYGACSTCALGLALGASLLEGGMCEKCASVTSSHYCSSERQFRFPLEYGGPRTPTSQWTVTGSGAFILGKEGNIKIKSAMFGKSVDMGVTDINNMGAAMAPAAVDTICSFLQNSSHRVEDFDMIVTGDLGYEGSEILKDLLLSKDIDIRKNHVDCGLLIYDRFSQDKHAGGSGCGCSASVLAGNILKNMEAGAIHDILFIGTGALMNPMTLYQGQSIPSIAHLVHIGR